MSADTNLSSDHMRVECVLERCEQERVANTSTDPVLSPIAGETCDEQFSEVAGLDRPARRRLACDLLKLEQSLNDNHVALSVSFDICVQTRRRVCGVRHEDPTNGVLRDTSPSISWTGTAQCSTALTTLCIDLQTLLDPGLEDLA